MRILMLSPHESVASPLTRITPLLADSLRGMGCDVAIEPWGRRADSERTLVKFVSRPRDIGRIHRVLSDGRFDALVVQTSHDHVSLLRDVPLLLAVRRSTPCVVFHFHGGHSEWLLSPGHHLFKGGSRLLFRLSDGILVLSRTQKSELERFAPGKVFRVVRNPFVPLGDPNGERARDRIPVVLFVSRLMAKKGIFDTLEAVAMLKNRLPCRLVVAGIGPEAATVRARVDELGLRDSVTLAGYLQGGDLADAYNSASVFVLPTYDSEGFPTAVAEAMGAGLPIVATRNRGIVDHLEEGVNVLYVRDRAPNELAAALERLLRDDALRSRMSAANLEKVGEFEPGAVARQYLGTLHEIAALGRQRKAAARG